MKTYILFKVGDSSYAIPTDWVEQVEMVQNITHVPNTPPFVEGIVFLRGRMIPVVNLRTLFGLDKSPHDLRSRLIVVRMNERIVGLQVDMAREFVHIDDEQILPPPEDLTGPGVDYLRGIVSLQDRLILVIDLDQLLNRDEKQAFTQSMNAVEEIEDQSSERKSSYV
jgi:chemotaxis signal transduction protein